MLRSLAAVLIAILIGLTFAKFIEGAMVAVAGLSAPASAAVEGNAKATISSGYGLVLGVSWLLGALVSAALALQLGRRWAPLGWLAGATVSFNGLVVLLATTAPFWLWLAALLVGPVGAYGAIRLLSAKATYPSQNRPTGPFE